MRHESARRTRPRRTLAAHLVVVGSGENLGADGRKRGLAGNEDVEAAPRRLDADVCAALGQLPSGEAVAVRCDWQ